MSLYDEIGGASAVTVAATVFSHRVTSDESLAPWFQHRDLDQLIAHQRAFLTIALGGPDVYTGRSMADAHAGLGTTDEAFDAAAEHLAYALLDVGLAREQVTAVIAGIQPLRAQIVDASTVTAD